MSTNRSGSGPDDGQSSSWTSETLPLSTRRELLERELKKLGFRKADGGHNAAASEAASGQQEGQSSSHPAAGDASQHGG